MMTAAQHGTYSRYVNGKCRCDLCRDANRRYQAGRRSERRTRLIKVEAFGETVLVHPDAEHGTVSGAKNYGCRCFECRTAHRDDMRRRRSGGSA